eukprot:96222_1
MLNQDPGPPPGGGRKNSDDGRLAKLKAFAEDNSRRLSKSLSGLFNNADVHNDDDDVKIPEGVADVLPEAQGEQDEPEVQELPVQQGPVQPARPAPVQRNRRRIGPCGRKSLYALLAIIIGGALFSGGFFGLKAISKEITPEVVPPKLTTKIFSSQSLLEASKTAPTGSNFAVNVKQLLENSSRRKLVISPR